MVAVSVSGVDDGDGYKGANLFQKRFARMAKYNGVSVFLQRL